MVVVIAALLVLCRGVSASSSSLLSVDFTTDASGTSLTYSVHLVDSANPATPIVTLRSGSFSFFAGGKEHGFASGQSAAVNDLKVVSSRTQRGVDPRLGAFSEKIAVVTAVSLQGATIEASVVSYVQHQNAVVFRLTVPNGLYATSSGNADGVVTSFPSFVIPVHNVTSQRSLGYAHFAGYMAGNYPQYGVWASDAASSWTLSGGIQNSGVMCIFSTADAASASPVGAVVISPFSNFMAASLQKRQFVDEVDGARKTEVAWGVMGNATYIPPGYIISWAVVGSITVSPLPTGDAVVAGSVNRAISEWGRFLRKAYNRDRHPHSRDVTLQTLGYATDNGAYYYYYTAPYSTYEELMHALKAHWAEKGIPYNYLQLDSWWYYREDGKDTSGVPLSGVTNWTAMPTIFPDGLPFVFANITQLPVMAHNRYYAEDTVYASNPQIPIGPSDYTGKTFEFAWGIGAGLPTSKDFWLNLFAINSNWGLKVYEQDWLSMTTSAMPQLQNNVTFGRDWLKQMGEAAAESNLTIQLCMSFPRHVLQALESPSMTQARASNDYQPQATIVDYDQWRIGESSMWIDAIGVAPSKDSFWTMPTSQYVPHYDPIFNTSETRNRLESLASTMSNGPVQISDRIGFSDVSLIMRSCTKSGRLLRPDAAATPIDRSFLYRAFVQPIGSAKTLQTPRASSVTAFNGVVHATYSIVDFTTQGNGLASTIPYLYVMAVGVQRGFDFTIADILPTALDAAGVPLLTPINAAAVPPPVFIAGFLYFEANTSTTLGVVDVQRSLFIPASDEYTFTFHTLVPVLSYQPTVCNVSTRWVLLGESGKWIAASRQRSLGFIDYACRLVPALQDVEMMGEASIEPGDTVTLRFARVNFTAEGLIATVNSTVITITCTNTASTQQLYLFKIYSDGRAVCD